MRDYFIYRETLSWEPGVLGNQGDGQQGSSGSIVLVLGLTLREYLILHSGG